MWTACLSSYPHFARPLWRPGTRSRSPLLGSRRPTSPPSYTHHFLVATACGQRPLLTGYSPATRCPLSAARCLLSAARCLLPTTHYPLPAAPCSLPAAGRRSFAGAPVERYVGHIGPAGTGWILLQSTCIPLLPPDDSGLYRVRLRHPDLGLSRDAELAVAAVVHGPFSWARGMHLPWWGFASVAGAAVGHSPGPLTTFVANGTACVAPTAATFVVRLNRTFAVHEVEFYLQAAVGAETYAMPFM
jgi:hypothetical protein